MKINDSDLFYTCSLLELIGRTTHQRRSAVVDILGKKVVAHIYAHAGTLHCEPIAHTADVFIEMCHVPQGEFDNLASCKYEIPDYWAIGKVYARLVEDVAREDLIDSLFRVYTSEVSDMISNYNSDFFYQPRDYIKEYYVTDGNPDGINLRIPDIRFKGFTGEWERRTLGEVCEITMGQSPDGATYSETPSDYILVQGNADLKNGWVCPRIWTTQKTKLAEAGDLIMSVRAPAGAMGKTAYNVVLGRGVAGIKGNEFIYQTLVRMDSDSYWKKLAAGSTFESINSDVVNNAEIFVPQNKDEQHQIGTVFAHLDALIALHERKCERLQNVKKSMLEKMFPKKGSNVPEIRFAGFSEPWEMRKLGELASVSMNRRIFKEQTTESGDVPFFKIGTFGSTPDAYISRELFEEYRAKYPYPKVGDILISASGSIGRTVEYSGKDEYFQDSNIVWINHDERIDNTFLKCFYSVVKWAGIEGSTIKRLYNDNILNTEICLPCVAEQQQIGSYFEHLDTIITLHQREIEKLKNIKKSMLEKLFV